MKTPKTSIFKTLELLQLTSTQSRSVFNKKTWDVEDLVVWRDDVSGVIYIDDFYTGEETYVEGTYRKEEQLDRSIGKPDSVRLADGERRFQSNLQFVIGKRVLDFGCGEGDFLRKVKKHCIDVCGVELQQDYVDALNSDGISCVNNLDEIDDNSIDICVSFHVIEHLPNPLDTLSLLKKKIVSGGMIVIEVPHSNDFLLSSLSNDSFKQFTLWSQHLVLHTRESLHRMLDYVGFKDVLIEGIQRYPLSNHLNWLANNKPGGHRSYLSAIDAPSLHEAYSNALSKIDATDTLTAVAKVT